MNGTCEMCLRKDVHLKGLGLCIPCTDVYDTLWETILNRFAHVSAKNMFRYLLTREHEVNVIGDHTDDDSCVYMHADCTHD
jgi:hypothetical protein